MLFTGGFVGSAGGGPYSGSTSFIAPRRPEIIDYNIVYDYSYNLILGNLSDIRGYVNAHPTDLRPNYHFNSDRQHWTLYNASDTGVPSGQWSVQNGAGGSMVGPESSFQAVTVPKLYIRAAYPSGTTGTGRLYWEINNNGLGFGTQSYDFQIIGDGQYHTYELDLASNPYYTGQIAVRLRPLNGVAGSVDVAYISMLSPSRLFSFFWERAFLLCWFCAWRR